MKRQLFAAVLIATTVALYPASIRAEKPAASLTRDVPGMKVASRVPFQAIPFPLTDVRLLDGPFLHAQNLDHEYLLSLDTERLLHDFRVNAALPSSAKPLRGWEDPTCELRGHFVGHYLTACAEMYAATGDKKLKERAIHVASELAKCQQALGPSGYLSAFPETFIDRVEERKQVWAPWYTLHKIYAGLMDVSAWCSDKDALTTARKMADWASTRTSKLSDDRMQAMLNTEQGGMNEAMANLYAMTGEGRYLTLSERFNHRAILDPLSKGVDPLDNVHANTQIPKIIGAAREYEMTGDDRYRDTARNFWKFVTGERSYVIGGNSDNEAFTPKARLSQALGPNTTETCNTYNMLKLTRHLFEWEPSSAYADYTERALFNHILASQNPETGMMCYYVPLRTGARRNFNTPNESFWCCTGTGVENHASYGNYIYYHDADRALYVNQFIASSVDWKDRGISLRQETDFPNTGATRLTVSCKRPTDLTLRIRRPAWVENGFAVSVNGTPVSAKGEADGYVEIARQWKTGDTVTVTLPMHIHTESFHDNPNRLAFLYGPVVLCSTGSTTPPPQTGNRIVIDRRFSALAIVGDRSGLTSDLSPAPDHPLTFTITKEARPEFQSANGSTITASDDAPITLTPFYTAYDRPYQVYWDVFTPDQWKTKQEAWRADEEQKRERAARTIDALAGSEQSERDHNQTGDQTAAGSFNDRRWRHSYGGWFAYDFKSLPDDTPQEMVCTYWGSDGGGREFDILVDGVKIVTQTLDNNKPGEFFDVVYPLPADLLHGKEHVTVRFQSHNGHTVGGVFGCAILRRSKP